MSMASACMRLTSELGRYVVSQCAHVIVTLALVSFLRLDVLWQSHHNAFHVSHIHSSLIKLDSFFTVVAAIAGMAAIGTSNGWKEG